MQEQSNKTEKATPYKLREAKKKGQVAKSIEITSLLMMLAFAAVFLMFADTFAAGLSQISGNLLLKSARFALTPENIMSLFSETTVHLLQLFAPIVAVLVLGAVLFNVLQTGLILTSHTIKPDFKKLNPVEGLKKLFSKKTLFGLFKALFKVVTIMLVWRLFGADSVDRITSAYGMSINAFVDHWYALSIQLFVLLTLLLLPLALLDVAFEKWDFAKKMMMSMQDIKDEHKKREGDPQVKQKQKEIQKELLKKAASLKRVKDADVVITNPEHIAVAIKYSPKQMLAPKVLSMGEDKNAAVIRQIARSHNVPIVRNIPLARKIYAESSIDGYIPESSYKDVAALLRHLLSQGLVVMEGLD